MVLADSKVSWYSIYQICNTYQKTQSAIKHSELQVLTQVKCMTIISYNYMTSATTANDQSAKLRQNCAIKVCAVHV